MQKLRLQTLPSRYWGPALVRHRRLIDYVDDFVVDPEGEKKQLAYVNRAFSQKSVQEEASSQWEDDCSVGTRVCNIQAYFTHPKVCISCFINQSEINYLGIT